MSADALVAFASLVFAAILPFPFAVGTGLLAFAGLSASILWRRRAQQSNTQIGAAAPQLVVAVWVAYRLLTHVWFPLAYIPIPLANLALTLLGLRVALGIEFNMHGRIRPAVIGVMAGLCVAPVHTPKSHAYIILATALYVYATMLLHYLYADRLSKLSAATLPVSCAWIIFVDYASALDAVAPFMLCVWLTAHVRRRRAAETGAGRPFSNTTPVPVSASDRPGAGGARLPTSPRYVQSATASGGTATAPRRTSSAFNGAVVYTANAVLHHNSFSMRAGVIGHVYSESLVPKPNYKTEQAAYAGLVD